MKLKLVLPNKKYLRSYQNYLSDFIKNDTKDCDLYKKQLASSKKQKFLLWLAWDRTGKNLEKGMVQQTTYWAVVGDRVVGRISFRHTLTKNLRMHGGNIGYAVRPSQRGKGYATEMLRQLLQKVERLKYKKVLLTCDVDNLASRKTIENNKGVLKEIKNDLHGNPSCFYWVKL